MSKRLSLGDSVIISDDVVFRELDGEAVILDLETGTYFGLNPVGSRMWSLLLRQESLRQVFETMRTEYEVAPDVLERDLLRLVTDLCERRLARVR